MSPVKRFRLERVGAGPGVVLFSCEHLLGASVEVVDAADYDRAVNGEDARDAARYRYLRNNPQFNGPVGRLEWYLPRFPRDGKTLAQRLDDTVDEEIKAKESRR